MPSATSTIICLAVTMAVPTLASATIVLDTFSNGTQSSFFIDTAAGAGTPSTVTGAWSDDPIGNARRITAGKPNVTVAVEGAGIGVSGGFANMSSGINAKGHAGIYYGTVADLNLNLSGESAFQLDFNSALTNQNLNVYVTTVGSGTSSVTSLTFSGTSVTVPFSSLTGSANWNDIDTITLDLFNLGGAMSAQLDTFSTVPEPGTLGILGLGCAALFRGRRLRGRPR